MANREERTGKVNRSKEQQKKTAAKKNKPKQGDEDVEDEGCEETAEAMEELAEEQFTSVKQNAGLPHTRVVKLYTLFREARYKQFLN